MQNNDNKEYIVNIRVSKDTYNKLKNKAKENSQTLSDLIRKTLDDSYEIFSDIRKDLFGDDKNKNGMIYYQKAILARDIHCDVCGNIVKKGTDIFIGETKNGNKKYFCNDCFIEK